MTFMTDGIMERFDYLEEQGLLSLNNDNTYLGTGGQGYTTALPASDFDGKVRTKDMGHAAGSGDGVLQSRHVR